MVFCVTKGLTKTRQLRIYAFVIYRKMTQVYFPWLTQAYVARRLLPAAPAVPVSAPCPTSLWFKWFLRIVGLWSCVSKSSNKNPEKL